MAATPILQEASGAPAGGASAMPGLPAAPGIEFGGALQAGDVERSLAVYPAAAGFDLVEELDYLSARSIEPNIFFNPRFLAPAMPRLEDRDVRLAVIRDEGGSRSRLRLLTPFTIEKPPLPFAVPVIRTWASPYGPLGTPLVDRDDPLGVVEDFFAILARPHLGLPRVMVMAEVRLDGPFAAMLGTLAESRGLPLSVTDRVDRPFLQSELDGEAYLRESLSGRQFSKYAKQKRKLAADHGEVVHAVARGPEEVRQGIEAFLALETAGWKGRARTAMAVDRYRAAFVREAAFRLSERDFCRVHMLRAGERMVAVQVVFIESGVAYTWKTAFDEAFAEYSPGALLMVEVTRSHLEDPNIEATDSCAMPDDPMMSRLWRERRPLGTLIVGLTPDSHRQARQAAVQLGLGRETRDFARRVRDSVKRVIRR